MTLEEYGVLTVMTLILRIVDLIVLVRIFTQIDIMADPARHVMLPFRMDGRDTGCSDLMIVILHLT